MMEKRLFSIVANDSVARLTWRLELSSPGYEFSGEFVDIAIDGYYLRRPLSVCSAKPGRMTLIYKVVGEGTRALALKRPGETLDLLTGLGRGFDASLCTESALLVGGGLGAAPLLMLARELRARGRHITAVLGFNAAEEIVLGDEFREVCDDVAIATLDGSVGVKGFVTDAIASLKPSYDCFYTCGPLVMMKVVCQSLSGHGQASLEERMGCGAGFCYGCSIQTTSGVKRVCKDGPVFDKEDIIW